MLNVRGLLKAHHIAARFRSELGAAGPKALLMVKEEGDTGTLYLYDQIGGDSFNEGITAKDVVVALDELKAKGCKAVDIRIASEGGDVFEGKAIYEAIKRCGMKTTAFNDSIAASAASFIAMAADKVVSAPSSTWMVHRAWALAIGNAEDLVSMSEILQLEDGNIAKMYAAKSKKPEAECLALMAAETWMNAEQAKEFGIADETAREADAENEDGASASAKAVVKIAGQTQERIRLHAAQVLLAQKNKIAQHRASPGQTRPAAAK